MGTATLNSSRFPWPHTHHIEVLGNSPFPKLLHPLTNIREAGIVIIRILLRQVVNVSQGTILRGGGERKKTEVRWVYSGKEAQNRIPGCHVLQT